jgi:hypothetical protein
MYTGENRPMTGNVSKYRNSDAAFRIQKSSELESQQKLYSYLSLSKDGLHIYKIFANVQRIPLLT